MITENIFMKRFLGFLIFSILFFCVSCTVWVPQEKYSSIFSKKTYTTIDEKLEPFVFYYPIYGNYKNSINSKQTSMPYMGNIIFFYDWKNDKILDYFYSNYESSHDDFMLYDFYNSDLDEFFYYYITYNNSNVICYSSSGVKTLIPSSKQNLIYYNFTKDENCSKIAGYYSRYIFDDSKGILCNFLILDLKKQKFLDPVPFYLDSYKKASNFIPDDEGNFWFTSILKGDNEQETSVLYKYDASTNKIIETDIKLNTHENQVYNYHSGWSGTENFEVVCANSDYLFIYNNPTDNIKDKKLLLINNKENLTLENTIVVNSTNEKDNFRKIIKLNGEVFLFYYSFEDKCVRIKKFNVNDGSFVLYENAKYYGGHLDNFRYRDGKLFIFDGYGTPLEMNLSDDTVITGYVGHVVSVDIYVFDGTDTEFSLLKHINFNDVIKN